MRCCPTRGTLARRWGRVHVVCTLVSSPALANLRIKNWSPHRVWSTVVSHRPFALEKILNGIGRRCHSSAALCHGGRRQAASTKSRIARQLGESNQQSHRQLRSQLQQRCAGASLHFQLHFGVCALMQSILAGECYALNAACVIAESVPRVVMTSGSSETSINVPSGLASAASNCASNSPVFEIFTPA